ncbi:FAD-dependent monooxygenase [Corynebacterium sp. YIM 101645]|uniref:FAD-dependent monooxygenase n=1 Tax=Corynebacterium lemuris TaxID=1859292 RepID=A0ABT2FSW1_9CORY|nr:FAD-dependent oxidoreductase [Corynebacterium lemuris]MCS5478211.1 FAD-dependent monooxygenase [Corynebacterium lemuris]
MPTFENNRPVKVAIVGGGIGGLSAAVLLLQQGHDVTVFEQAPEIKEVGAGLVMAPNAVRLLRRMGALDRFTSTAVQLEQGWEFRRWDNGTVLSVENLDTRCQELYGEHTYVSHRADLLEAIGELFPPERLHLGSRVADVAQDADGVTLTMEDGTIHTAEILIGADGVHSVVRQHLVGTSPAEDSGMSAFRSLVPVDKAPEFARRPAQTLWIGPEHHLVHYPVSSGKYINLVAFAPAGAYTRESWTATVDLEEFQAEFTGWDPRLEELIANAERPGRWALLDRAPLKQWSYGRITLMGDAAHPMFPFFAQGAAQAIEDAAVLADSVTRFSDDLETALINYQDRRIERATRLQEASHARKDINHLPDGPEQQARDAALNEGDPLVKSGWIYSYDPAQDIETGVLA